MYANSLRVGHCFETNNVNISFRQRKKRRVTAQKRFIFVFNSSRISKQFQNNLLGNAEMHQTQKQNEVRTYNLQMVSFQDTRFTKLTHSRLHERPKLQIFFATYFHQVKGSNQPLQRYQTFLTNLKMAARTQRKKFQWKFDCYKNGYVFMPTNMESIHFPLPTIMATTQPIGCYYTNLM